MTTYEKFFAADRNVGLWFGGLTVCASWLWGVALLASSQQAFIGGIAQFLWFAIPNVLALILFAFLTLRIREVIPNGYTILDVIDNGVRPINIPLTISFWGITLFTEVYSFTVQLTAAVLLLSFVVPYAISSIAFVVASLMYLLVYFGGLNVITKYADIFKMGLVLGLLGAVGYVFSQAFWMIQPAQMNFSELFSWKIAVEFGLPISISLLSGVVVGNQVWQRNTALSSENVQNSFCLGAMIFWIVLFGLGVLGLISVGVLSLFHGDFNTQLVGVFTLYYFLPELTTVLVWALVGVLIVSGASALSSFGALLSADINHGIESKESAIPVAKLGMLGVYVIGTTLAIIQIPLITMLQFLGIRAAFFIPFLLILYAKVDTKFSFSLTFSIWLAIIIYLGMFFGLELKAYAALTALALPGFIYIQNKSAFYMEKNQ